MSDIEIPTWVLWVFGVSAWLVAVVAFVRMLKRDDGDYRPMD